MRPRDLMKLGALCGLATMVVAVLGDQEIPLVTAVAFGSGALFGKGYGIWEERSSRATKGGRE